MNRVNYYNDISNVIVIIVIIIIIIIISQLTAGYWQNGCCPAPGGD